MEAVYLLVLFFVGVIASVINVGAGGGSSLTLPVLIFLGLDSVTANGTNRIGVICQNIFAVLGFHQEKMNNFKLSLIYSALTLPGAIAGALLATHMSDLWFQRILGIVMILIVATMFLPQMRDDKIHSAAWRKEKWLMFAALFGIGFYGGFLQVGVGFLIMATLFHLARLPLVVVNVHKVFMVFLFTVPAFVIFLLNLNVNWQLGLTLAAGNGVGGWLAARISVKKGERFIRIILAVAISIMAVKLLTDF